MQRFRGFSLPCWSSLLGFVASFLLLVREMEKNWKEEEEGRAERGVVIIMLFRHTFLFCKVGKLERRKELIKFLNSRFLLFIYFPLVLLFFIFEKHGFLGVSILFFNLYSLAYFIIVDYKHELSTQIGSLLCMLFFFFLWKTSVD
jgi:hypothetical protein